MTPILVLTVSFTIAAPADALDPAKIAPEFRLPDQPAEVVGATRIHTRAIAALTFSPDGQTLASTGWDNRLVLYRITDGKLKETADLRGSPSSILFSADGKLLYAGGDDDYIHVWDVTGKNPKARPKMSGHENRPFALAMSPGGKMLASGCGEPVLRIWKMEADGPEVWGILANETVPSLGIAALSFSHDGKYLAAGHHAGKNTLRIWDVQGNYMDELEPLPKTQTRLVAFSPKEPLLALSNGDDIRLWEVKDGKATPKLKLTLPSRKGVLSSVKTFAFSPDGKWLASTGLDRKIILWDVAKASKAREWAVTLEPRALMFAPDSRHLAVGNEEGAVFVLRLARD